MKTKITYPGRTREDVSYRTRVRHSRRMMMEVDGA